MFYEEDATVDPQVKLARMRSELLRSADTQSQAKAGSSQSYAVPPELESLPSLHPSTKATVTPDMPRARIPRVEDKTLSEVAQSLASLRSAFIASQPSPYLQERPLRSWPQ